MAHKYPDFVKATKYGSGEGLCGWNCYHSFSPFLPGFSTPVYTEEELKKLNELENTPIKYNGKEYTRYEATQRQRSLERTLHAKNQAVRLLREGGADESDIQIAEALYRKTSHEYVQFSKAMGLPQQRQRVQLKNLADNNVKSLTSVGKSGIIKNRKSGVFVKTKYFDGELQYYAITDERKNSIKPVAIESLSAENNSKLTNACKDLLTYMQNEPLGKEGLIAFNMSMGEIDRYKAVGTNAQVKLKKFSEDCIVIHNHPDGLIFSESDVSRFIAHEEIKTLGAVGNNGSTYFIEKLKNFDVDNFNDYMYDVRIKYFPKLEPEQHIKFIEEVLEGVDKYGIRLYISKN